jgi:RNA polymerase sigma-70 factor (ECF subfamily)
MDSKTYLAFLRAARRLSRRADEAGDLLQTALLAALEAQRGDMTRAENRRWLEGVLRNRALHEARSAARRRRRESAYGLGRAETQACPAAAPDQFVTALPPALRTTALLALTGHTKPEIAWLLGLSDAALRQRISQIRRRWRQSGLQIAPGLGEPRGNLPFGLVRRALIKRVQDAGVVLATHDPDGHLFVVATAPHKMAGRGNQGTSERETTKCSEKRGSGTSATT